MEPLEARTLYPIGGVLNPARMNIECRADSQHQFRIPLLQVFRHEALLLWRAETYPKDVGLQFREPKREFSLLSSRQQPKGRTKRADNSQPGKSLDQSFFEPVSRKLLGLAPLAG